MGRERQMATSPGFGFVSAASKTWQWSVFGTCVASLLSPMLCHIWAYRSCSLITSQPALLSQSAVPQLSYRSRGKDFTPELSKWVLQLQLGAVHSAFQRRGTFLPGTGFTAVFPSHSFLPGNWRKLQWVPQSTIMMCNPQPLSSGKHNQQTPCWMRDYWGLFFSFSEW